MSVTDRLMELDPSLNRHPEGNWNSIVINLPTYSSFNDAGVECETGEFLYGMVRVLQPERILETGSHVGVGACYLGMGLKDNNKGILETYEFIPELHERAKRRIEFVGLNDFVKCFMGDFGQVELTGEYDMAFLDTEPQTRFNELVRVFPHVKEGGYIFIHDLNRHLGQVANEEHGFAWPWGRIPEAMHHLFKSGQLVPFYFNTPRGLSGFYKVHPGDHKFI